MPSFYRAVVKVPQASQLGMANENWLTLFLLVTQKRAQQLFSASPRRGTDPANIYCVVSI